jgi:hypothetical protein
MGATVSARHQMLFMHLFALRPFAGKRHLPFCAICDMWLYRLIFVALFRENNRPTAVEDPNIIQSE